MYQNFMYYMRFYRDYGLEAWSSMGPTEYGTLLLGVGVFGWLLMKNGAR